jgi:hypothetical protein
MNGWERIPFLPRGELHPYDRCAYCGAPARRVRLRHATLPTLAGALVCENTVTCIRRRYRARNGNSSTSTGRWAA